MTNAENRSTSGKNAKSSRQAGVCADASARDDRHCSWTRPLSRTEREIDATVGLIARSLHVIEESERSAAGHPIRATRNFQCVSGWLVKAAAHLERAALGLQVAADRVEQSPQFAGDAPVKLFDASFRWASAAGELAKLSNRLDDSFNALVDSVTSGAIPIPIDEQTVNPGAPVRFIRPTPLTIPLELLLGRDAPPCIPSRRRRSACPTFEDAARRIFRGRAPPLFSTCSL